MPDPILNVTDPVYVPAVSCAFRLEAEIVILLEAPEFNVPVVGLANNQFPPLLVCGIAVQLPFGPQLLTFTACAVGSLTFAIPLKFNVAGFPEMQPPCTVNVTCKDCDELAGWLVNATVTV